MNLWGKHTIALFDALKRDDLIEVARYLDSGFSADSIDLDGTYNPLHVAVIRNNQAMIELLLSKGANPNGNRQKKMTPLHLAIEDNDRAIFNILLDAGANPWLFNEDGNTVAHLWIKNFGSGKKKHASQNPIVLQDIIALCQNGLLINQRNINGNTLLMLAVLYGSKDEVLEELLRLGADHTATNALGNQAIHTVQHSGFSNALKTLIKHGADINTIDWSGNTLLHFVGNENLIVEIIALGGSVNAQNKYGDTPMLSMLKRSMNTDTVGAIQSLLTAGADPDRVNHYGETPRAFATTGKFNLVLDLFAAYDAKKAMLQIATSVKNNV